MLDSTTKNFDQLLAREPNSRFHEIGACFHPIIPRSPPLNGYPALAIILPFNFANYDYLVHATPPRRA